MFAMAMASTIMLPVFAMAAVIMGVDVVARR